MCVSCYKDKLTKLLNQKTCCQTFVTDEGHACVFPLKNESDILLSLKLFAKDVRMFEDLVTDSAKTETSSEVKRFCINISTNLKTLEHGALWGNLAELHVGVIKLAVSKHMKQTNSHLRHWDYCIE